MSLQASNNSARKVNCSEVVTLDSAPGSKTGKFQIFILEKARNAQIGANQELGPHTDVGQSSELN